MKIRTILLIAFALSISSLAFCQEMKLVMNKSIIFGRQKQVAILQTRTQKAHDYIADQYGLTRTTTTKVDRNGNISEVHVLAPEGVTPKSSGNGISRTWRTPGGLTYNSRVEVPGNPQLTQAADQFATNYVSQPLGYSNVRSSVGE